MDLKHRSLKTVFIQYLISIIVSIVCVIVILASSLLNLVKLGVILPANYDEQIAYALKEKLEGKETLVSEDFENKCSYILFDNENNLIDTNIEDLKPRQDDFKDNVPTGKYYVRISGQNQYAMIEYQFIARYTSPFLEDYFPNVEIMYLILLLGVILLDIIVISNRYGRKLKRALEPLEQAVIALEKHNLDFEVTKSEIKEFNEIGASIQSMKAALQESLVNQWLLEKKKGEQMAALAHDIKTPLTIIKGSAELLEEEDNLNEEQHSLSTSIRRNSDKIYEYVKLLMEISNEGVKEELHTELVNLEVFVDKIVEQTKALAKLKDIDVVLEVPNVEICLDLDIELMSRALMNVIGNAIDYTSAGAKIVIEVQRRDKEVTIGVIDEGTGFTKEALQKACEPFYMGDTSRNNKGHYGMGLYIAKQIVAKHKGSLVIQNNIVTNGGEVLILLPAILKHADYQSGQY